MKIGVSLPVREMADNLVAIRDFAQAAEGLGLTHLRIPDQIMRPGSGHLHEPMMLLAYIAAVTEKIELVPSVIILPVRQTVHFAKQAAELDHLSGGRVRLGIGVGGSEDEYREERDKRLRADGLDQYLEMKGELAHYMDDPYVESGFERDPLVDEVDVAARILDLPDAYADVPWHGVLYRAGG